MVRRSQSFRVEMPDPRIWDTPALPDRLSVTGVHYWGDYIPLSFDEALQMLTRDLPEETLVNLTLRAGERGNIQMRAEGIFDETWGRGREGRPVDFYRKELGQGSLVVDPNHRGSGIGRYVLRNEMEFSYQCGITHFNICAGYSAGGYTWARQGFLPVDVMIDHFRHLTKIPVGARYDAIRPYLEDEHTAILDDAVEFHDPHDMWRIADRGPIGSKLRDVFAAVAREPNHSTRPEAISFKAAFNVNSAYHGGGEEALQYIESAVQEGRPVTVGQVLLAGTEWAGHVDMMDAEQMARVGSYVGGWRYIPQP